MVLTAMINEKVSSDPFASRPWHISVGLPGAPWGFLRVHEAHLLFALARDYCTGAGVLVDAGSFLGRSAWHFATGLASNGTIGPTPRRLVHCFDNFRVNEQLTTDTIGRQFGEHLALGDSTRHLFDAQTQSVEGWLQVHEGDFHSYDWPVQPIEVLLVDIAKTPSLGRRTMEIFYPCLLPGRSIVVHQDYHHPWLPHIHVSMELLHEYFELVEVKVDDSAAFRLRRPIPSSALAAAARCHELPFDDQLALMDRAVDRLPADGRRHVELARANLLAGGRGYAAMREAMTAIDAKYPPDDCADPHWGAYRRDMLRILDETRVDLPRGWSLVKAGDSSAALALAEAVPEDHSHFADALVLRIHCLRRLARKEEAVPLAERAIALRPDHAPTLVEGAWLAIDFGAYQVAVETARRALAHSVDAPQRAFSNDVLAFGLSHLGRHEEALAAGQAAVDAVPNTAWTLVRQANCLLRGGRTADARRLASKALALEPENEAARAALDAANQPA